MRGRGAQTDEIRVYPNPTSADIHVGLILQDGEIAMFELYSVMGAKVRTAHLKSGMNTIGTEGVKQGMNYYRIIVNNEVRHSGKEVIVR